MVILTQLWKEEEKKGGGAGLVKLLNSKERNKGFRTVWL